MKRYPMIAALGAALLSVALLAPSVLAQNNLPSSKASSASPVAPSARIDGSGVKPCLSRATRPPS